MTFAMSAVSHSILLAWERAAVADRGATVRSLPGLFASRAMAVSSMLTTPTCGRIRFWCSASAIGSEPAKRHERREQSSSGIVGRKKRERRAGASEVLSPWKTVRSPIQLHDGRVANPHAVIWSSRRFATTRHSQSQAARYSGRAVAAKVSPS